MVCSVLLKVLYTKISIVTIEVGLYMLSTLCDINKTYELQNKSNPVIDPFFS